MSTPALDEQRSAAAGVAAPGAGSKSDAMDLFRRNAAAFASAGWLSGDAVARAEAIAQRMTESGEALSSAELDEQTRDRVRPMVDDGVRGLSPLIQVGMDPVGKLRLIGDLVVSPKIGPYRQHVIVIEPELERFARACLTVDLADVASSEWLHGFVGRDAVERFGGWLESRVAFAMPGAMSFARDGDAERGVLARLQGEAKRVNELQAVFCKEQADRLSEMYRGRSPIDTHLELGNRVRGACLRVLLITSTRTAYLKRSFEDLAKSMRSDGHTVTLAYEPTAADTWVSGALCEVIADAAPDLVIASNFPRSAMPEALPEGLPYVCWVQDMMTPLLTPSLGGETTEWDVFCGVNMGMLRDKLGVGSDRLMPFCVPASGRKFHPRPVPDELRERYECDVAFVSNHGETPEAMRDRLAAMSPDLQKLVFRAYERAEEIVERSNEQDPARAADAVTRELIEAFTNRGAQDAETERIKHAAVAPIAARMFRHRTLDWVAEVCERRGWRFKLFGTGWENSRVARYGGGPVAHGEELRACYQSAGVHLHLDINGPLHQRVIECALSGGLPAVRLHAGLLSHTEGAVLRELWATGEPPRVEADGTRVFDATDGESVVRHQVVRHQAVRRALGLAEQQAFRVETEQPPAGLEGWAGRNVSHDPLPFFGDFTDVGFADRDGLERLVERAVGDRAWRESVSAEMEQHARAHLTTDVFARRLLDFASRAVGARSFGEGALGWVRFGLERGFVPKVFGMPPDEVRTKYVGA